MSKKQSSEWESGYIRPVLIGMAWLAATVAAAGIAIYAAVVKMPPAYAWVIALPLVVAFLISLLFWYLPLPDEARTGTSAGEPVDDYSPEKVKRGETDQLAMLLSLMDEDEIAAFKTRLQDRVIDDLAGSDGELPDDATLEMLLTGDRDAARN